VLDANVPVEVHIAEVEAVRVGAGNHPGGAAEPFVGVNGPLGNADAAEAAGAGGRVEIRLAGDGQSAEASVSDSGPGISPEARARLFEPFFTTKDHGTGLGLAVSQAIARAHRGSIEVDEAPAGGARFTLRLPGAAGGSQP
jgi:C4-dicarboxylate-specific signal transduction histidine kinase